MSEPAPSPAPRPEESAEPSAEQLSAEQQPAEPSPGQVAPRDPLPGAGPQRVPWALLGKPLPALLQPRFRYPQVRSLGYSWPAAGRLERVFWAGSLLACLSVLYLAAFRLNPERSRGIGTHEQLGLPPCGFPEMTGGYPCPSCGYTTTFTLAAQGNVLEAFVNQPFGFLVFVLTVLAVPLAALATFRRVSLFAASERWPWQRLFVSLVLGWLLAWGYKCWRLVP